MSLLLEVAIIFAICILGEALAILLPIPIPGNIIGMMMLLIFLIFKWVKPTHIQNVSQFLLKNMAFFFIPAGVTIIKNDEHIRGQVVAILFVCIVSTIITFGVTGCVAQWVITYQKNRKEGRHE